MSDTLPPGATVYAKRPFPSPEKLGEFLNRELSIVERAIRDRRLRLQRTVTDDLTLTNQDDIIYADATGGAITITLPDARKFWGYSFTIKRINAGANAVTVDAGASTIDGSASYPITVQYEAITPTSDGSQWWIV